MIGARGGKSGSQGSGWLKQRIWGLFAPPVHDCAYCRKPVKMYSNPLRLCDACFRSIPWIREVLCPVCGRSEVCFDCVRRTTSHFTMNRSAVRYDDAMKEMLARFKYRGDERLQQLMGTMLLQGYNHYMRLPEIKQQGFDIVTFVPLSEHRLAERGFNQAEQLARTVGQHMNRPVLPMLARTKHTGKQSFKTRSERLTDMSGVFAIDPTRFVEIAGLGAGKPLQILIVDDVYTTGSTLNECASVIRKSIQANVYGLSWAR